MRDPTAFTVEERNLFDAPSLLSPAKIIAEYEFWADLQNGRAKKLGIRILADEDGIYFYRISHHIKTPLQSGAFVTVIIAEEDLLIALKKGIESIQKPFQQAIKSGHFPSSDWFTPNLNF